MSVGVQNGVRKTDVLREQQQYASELNQCPLDTR
jgi:hypothetical protein